MPQKWREEASTQLHCHDLTKLQDKSTIHLANNPFPPFPIQNMSALLRWLCDS